MSKKLDINNNIKLWLKALVDAKAGKRPICPRCGSADTEIQKEIYKDKVGYMIITCNSCGKSGYFSRVLF